MPEWVIERGIGETRAALVDEGEIIEARISLDGTVAAGRVVPARLTSIGTNGRNAVARDDSGTEYLLPRGAPGVPQGQTVAVEVTREAIPGAEPWKRPLARVTNKPPAPPSTLRGRELTFPSPKDELGEAGWEDLLEQARSSIIRFAGGEIRVSPTPAMTLIDVDGYLPPDELATRGAAEAGRAIRRLDIGGSIGIDLPTSGSKAARQDAAAAIDSSVPQPFERTAVNGFGFVQIVRPRLRASLLELAQDRPSFEARALLRRAARARAGGTTIVAHPAVISTLSARPGWTDALSRQVGGAVELRSDPSLPISGGYAERL